MQPINEIGEQYDIATLQNDDPLYFLLKTTGDFRKEAREECNTNSE